MTAVSNATSVADTAQIQSLAETARDNAQYQAVADKLIAPTATQDHRDRAYDIVSAEAAKQQGPLTDAALADQAAEAIAADRTIPVNVNEISPLVPRGTLLGPFDSGNAAAVAMMDYSNPESIRENLENGGLVFQDGASGNFYVTTPMMGTLAGFNPGQVPQPDNMTMYGCYHGHADYSKADGTRTDKAGDEFNSDHFSAQDKRVAQGGYWGDMIYVSTPNGSFRSYDGQTRIEEVLREPTRVDAQIDGSLSGQGPVNGSLNDPPPIDGSLDGRTPIDGSLSGQGPFGGSLNAQAPIDGSLNGQAPTDGSVGRG